MNTASLTKRVNWGGLDSWMIGEKVWNRLNYRTAPTMDSVGFGLLLALSADLMTVLLHWQKGSVKGNQVCHNSRPSAKSKYNEEARPRWMHAWFQLSTSIGMSYWHVALFVALIIDLGGLSNEKAFQEWEKTEYVCKNKVLCQTSFCVLYLRKPSQNFPLPHNLIISLVAFVRNVHIKSSLQINNHQSL